MIIFRQIIVTIYLTLSISNNFKNNLYLFFIIDTNLLKESHIKISYLFMHLYLLKLKKKNIGVQ